MIPFSLLLIFAGNYPVLSVLGIFIGCISLVFINTFVNTIINKSDALLYSILGIIIITAALHFLHIIDVFAISEKIFYIYTHWFTFLIPFILLIIIGFILFFH
jgi:hypothetical protein